MDFALRPPEVNSGLMYAGAGAGPMLAAAASWDAVAAQLESTASGYSSTISGLTGLAWFGPSSMMMAAAAAHHVAWLHATATAAVRTSAQAYAAVAAYEAAFAMTVPPHVIVANRTLKMALVATNFFGQNTPAIAATDAHYMAMWTQDAAAMYAYAADSKAATTLTSFSEPSQTTNQQGQADQARSVAQSTGNTTSSRTQSVAQLSSTATHSSDPVEETGDYTDTTGPSVTSTITPDADETGDAATFSVESGTAYVYPFSDASYPIAMLTASSNPYTLTEGTEYVFLEPSSTAILDIQGGSFDITGGAITPLTPLPSTSGVAAAPPVAASAAPPVAASASPGLAGTAGIQPQLNVDALLGTTAVCTPARAGLLGQVDCCATTPEAGVPTPL